MSQYGIVHIGQFDQSDCGNEPEGLFEYIDKEVGEKQKYTIDSEIDEHIVIQFREVAFGKECISHVGKAVSEKDEQGAAHELGATRKVAEAVDGGHAHDELQEDEFECERRRKSTDKYRNEVYIECGARVEEGDHDNGNNGERNQIYTL